MDSNSIYKKDDRVWVQTTLKGGTEQNRPATIISLVDDHYFYPPEPYILVRFDDYTCLTDEFECLPLKRIIGLIENLRNDTLATGENNHEPNNPDNHYHQQEP